MKTSIICLRKSYFKRVSKKPLLRIVSVCVFLLASIHSPLQAQDIKFTKSPWWFGSSGGLNLNLYHGSVNQLNRDLLVAASFHNRQGIGYFAFPLIEYRKPGKNWGFMIQTGYDSRKGSFNELVSTKLAYLTVEPSLRLNLFGSPLFFYTGPRFAFNTDKRFTYQPGNELASSGGVLSDMKRSVISMQAGFGYDLLLTPKNKKSQVILSPFVAFHPYFGQNPRSIESWNMTTIRGGLAMKFGRGLKTFLPEKIFLPVVISPETQKSDLITEVKETESTKKDSGLLPDRKDLFFSLKPSTIEDPFSRTGKKHLKKLNSGKIEIVSPEVFSDDEFVKTIQENNFLNGLGESLKVESSSQIALIGSSGRNSPAGKQMAESVKIYLEGVYGIESSRITIKDRSKIKLQKRPSERNFELAVLRQSDRQVLVLTKSKSLYAKVRDTQNNQLLPLKIYEVPAVDQAGYVRITTQGSGNVFSSWTLKITDGRGFAKDFGPYSSETISISKKCLLGDQPAGNFGISMIGQSESGQIVRKDTSVFISAWPVLVTDKIMRFSVLYEFNNSKSLNIFNWYIENVVVPKIPSGTKIIIHGHSENLNYGNFDLKSFLSHENSIREVIENALKKADKTGVELQVFDFGTDQILAPFDQGDSILRFSPRTAIIDIIRH
ncbi:MAG: hypothetical protein WAO52_17845 [Prolixibacteraceae bacterium]